jgi:hypothetical protein
MGTSPVYRFWFADPVTDTQTVPHEDQKRILAFETQLFQLYSLFGNGVLTGWEIEKGNSNQIRITPGTGHVGFKAAATTIDTMVTLEVPSDLTFPTDGIKYYIFGKETSTTSIDKSIEFFASTNQLTVDDYNKTYISGTTVQLIPGGLINIGEIVLQKNSLNEYILIDPTYDTRNEISILNNLSTFIKNHLHTGGANNPPKIDLFRHVKGQLASYNIDNLDADKITKGTLHPDRQSVFDHNDLENSGILTHEQIESIILALELNQTNYLDDVFMTNFLQLLMFLKHVFAQIDENIKNTIIYVPGIAPAPDWTDYEHTTATIDEINHRIIGELASPASSSFITWDTKEEFEYAVEEYNLDIDDYPDSYNYTIPPDTVKRSSNIVINDDNTITLEKSIDFSEVYNLNNPIEWKVVTQIISNDSFGRNGTFNVDVNIGNFWLNFFTVAGSSTISAQDWSGNSKLEFSFRLDEDDETSESDTIDHGDIYLFLIGAVPSGYDPNATEQITFDEGSETKILVHDGILILEHDKYTDGPDGYQYVSIDLSQFEDLTTVSGIGFYTTTATGWDPQTIFNFRIRQPQYTEMSSTSVRDYLKENDDKKTIAMYRYNDQLYKKNGFIRFRFTPNEIAQWDYLRVDETIPTYTGIGSAPDVLYSTRASNTEAELILADTIYATVSEDPTVYDLHQTNTQWIEVTATLLASYDRTKTPILSSMTLYYTCSSESNIHSWDTYETWQDYDFKYNIAITDDPDKIQIEDTSEVNIKYFIDGNIIRAIDSDGNDIPEKTIDGINLPISPIQAFYKMSSGFIHPSKITKLDTGGFIIADTGNDRLIELESDGSVVRIIQGNSYLPLKSRDYVVLSASYNSRLGQVAILFSQDLDYSNFDLTKIVMANNNKTNQMNFGEDNVLLSSEMLGSTLRNNTEPFVDTDFSSIGNTPFDAGSQKQTVKRTFIPGIGKTRTNSNVLTTIGSILLLNLDSDAVSRVDTWGDDLQIIIHPDFYPLESSGLLLQGKPSAMWFEKETVPTITFKEEFEEHPTDAFIYNYNPFITTSSSLINGTYSYGDYATSDVGIEQLANQYNLIPYIVHDSEYITDPRYSCPEILDRLNQYYVYPDKTLKQIYMEENILSDEEWEWLGDFNENGTIDTNYFQDIKGNDYILNVDVDVLDIMYYDIFSPISIEKDGTSYLIAQANKISVFSISIENTIEWNATDEVIPFTVDCFGGAKYLTNGNVLVISPATNIIGELVISTKTVVDSISTKYSPVDAIRDADQNTTVVMAQRSLHGLNSKAYVIDSSSNVTWEWGIGRISFPTGISITDEENYLISC